MYTCLHIRLNSVEFFCLHFDVFINLSCRMDVITSVRSWLINIP